MKTLAFLACQWFPEKSIPAIKAAYARHCSSPEDRADLNARYLFFRCKTGQRLRATFGSVCDDIVWENASKEIGSRSSAKFPADLDHMESCIIAHRPDVVITFGRLAGDAIGKVWKRFTVKAPHPAARGPDVLESLKNAALDLNVLREAIAVLDELKARGIELRMGVDGKMDFILPDSTYINLGPGFEVTHVKSTTRDDKYVMREIHRVLKSYLPMEEDVLKR